MRHPNINWFSSNFGYSLRRALAINQIQSTGRSKQEAYRPDGSETICRRRKPLRFILLIKWHFMASYSQFSSNAHRRRLVYGTKLRHCHCMYIDEWRRVCSCDLENVLATSGGHTAMLTSGLDFVLVFTSIYRSKTPRVWRRGVRPTNGQTDRQLNVLYWEYLFTSKMADSNITGQCEGTVGIALLFGYFIVV